MARGGEILYLRALQGHSGRNLIDPPLQGNDNVLIPDDFFKNIYHVGCAINLHSIINSGFLPGGQHLNNRQTLLFLLVDPMDKNHKDLDTIDLMHRVVHNTRIQRGRNIKTRCIGSTSNLLKRKGLSSIRHDPPSFFTIHSQPIVSRKLSGWKLEKSYTKKYMNHLGSEVTRQAEDNQPTQPKPFPIYRTERPVVTEQTSRSSAQGIDTRFSLGCESANLFVERLEKDKDTDKRRRCR